MSIIIQNIIIKIFKVISIPNCLIFDLNNFIRLFQLLLIIRTVLKLPILLLLNKLSVCNNKIKKKKKKKKKEMENYR